MNSLSRNVIRASLGAAAVAAGFAFASPGAASADTAGSIDTGSSTIDELGRQTLGVDLGSSDMSNALGTAVNALGVDSAIGELGAQLGIDTGSLGIGPSVQPCNAQTVSGHDGVTTTRHIMGRGGPYSFPLDYETEYVPDDIQVQYQGRTIADTGWVGDQTNEGTGTMRVNVPAGTSDSVLVRVDGGTHTDWSYTVHCPN